MLKNFIKLTISILIPTISAVVIMILGAIFINKTNIGEGSVPLFSVISTALSSGMMSFMLSKLYKIKNIYCIIIAVVIFVLFKVILTVISGYKIAFSMNNFIDMAFVVIFSFVGSLVCSTIKK